MLFIDVIECEKALLVTVLGDVFVWKYGDSKLKGKSRLFL